MIVQKKVNGRKWKGMLMNRFIDQLDMQEVMTQIYNRYKW